MTSSIKVDEQDNTMKVCGFVELIGTEENCSSETETQCTLNITSDASYGVSVMLSNAYGSSAAKTFYFNCEYNVPTAKVCC